MNNNLDISKPFIVAIEDTLNKMADIKVQSVTCNLKEESFIKGDISAIIGMNGHKGEKSIKGTMLISWSEEVYVKMASLILMEEYHEFCQDIADTGAEICNIVMGNAKRDLVDLGYKIEMATPNTILGKNHIVQYPPKVTIIEISFETEVGDLQIELSYLEI